MWWFFGMQSLPIGFCFAYFVHSLRRRRHRQAAVIGVLTAINLASVFVLMYEFLR